MHASVQGLPADDALAPLLSSPLCCFKLQKKNIHEGKVQAILKERNKMHKGIGKLITQGQEICSKYEISD